jgi:hypothetical protein
MKCGEVFYSSIYKYGKIPTNTSFSPQCSDHCDGWAHVINDPGTVVFQVQH